jgi:hypothetical protein
MSENLEEMVREAEEEMKKHQLVPYLDNSVEIERNFQLKTEDDLISHTIKLRSHLETSKVVIYYLIGEAINSFYKKSYGQNELQKIAEHTEINIGTLHKACLFARNYTHAQVKELLTGKFVMAWRQIAQNLSVKPKALVVTYEKSNNPSEFNNAVIKLKNPNEKRGKRADSSENPDESKTSDKEEENTTRIKTENTTTEDIGKDEPHRETENNNNRENLLTELESDKSRGHEFSEENNSDDAAADETEIVDESAEAGKESVSEGSEPGVNENQANELVDIDDIEDLRAKIIELQNALKEKDNQLQLKNERIAELKKEIEKLKACVQYSE